MSEKFWMEEARRYARNADYYRDLVEEIGANFGVVAKLADDGSLQEDIICSKVPELVKRVFDDHQLTHARGHTGCPCLYTTPCGSKCTCAHPGLSGGCSRCATYGSIEQRKLQAQDLVDRLEGAERTALFEGGSFKLRSGGVSEWKINCDALLTQEWAVLARLIARRVGPFGKVEGIPQGGLKLAQHLEMYVRKGNPHILIVDDVCTLGGSLKQKRAGRDLCKGAVVFARGISWPTWVKPLFVLNEVI